MMARFIILSLFLFAGVCSASRIVGGSDATVEQYPSIVSVEVHAPWAGPLAWGHYCGGTILNSMFVLSAAHCFEGFLYKLEWRRIRAGTTYPESGGVIVNLAKATNHPDYNSTNSWNADITVLRLASPLTLSPVIQQASIIAPGFLIPDNVPVVYAGWGAIRWQGPLADVLQHVQVYTINNDLCRERYKDVPSEWPGDSIVTQNMICTGILDVGGRDSCQGDSGGPLYYQNILVGVVSWGFECAHETFPGVATAVSSYTNWIIETAVL